MRGYNENMYLKIEERRNSRGIIGYHIIEENCDVTESGALLIKRNGCLYIGFRLIIVDSNDIREHTTFYNMVMKYIIDRRNKNINLCI